MDFEGRFIKAMIFLTKSFENWAPLMYKIVEHIKESAAFEQPNFDVCLETARPIISIIAPKGHSYNGSRVLENLWKSTRDTMIIWNLFTKLLFTKHSHINVST